MKKSFGTLPSGEETFLYTISCGKLSAAVTDYGAALETQFYPDSLHHPGWPQPITRAGETYRSETVYRFSWDS